MNWEAIGAIGETLGSIAVFITLGYLAIQVRHTRHEVRRALSQGRGEAVRGVMALVQGSHDIQLKANAALGGQPGPGATALMEQAGLTLEEAELLLNHQFAWWSYRVQIIPYVDQLPEIERTAFDWGIRQIFGGPGVGRVFYETFVKPSAHPDAVRYIEDLLAKAD